MSKIKRDKYEVWESIRNSLSGEDLDFFIHADYDVNYLNETYDHMCESEYFNDDPIHHLCVLIHNDRMEKEYPGMGE